MRETFIVFAIVLTFGSAGPARAHGDIHRQIAEVTRLLAEDGENAELYYKRGRLHLEHESWDEALADLDEARRIRPDLPELDYHVGRALYGAGRAARASEVLAAYLERLGQGEEVRGARVRAHFLNGRVLSSLGRPVAAAAAFERCVEAAATPLPDQYLQWARALEAAGRPVEARASFERALGVLGEMPAHRRHTRAFTELGEVLHADLESLPSESRVCPYPG
jgi:tetratricopeptide (TPR) repeat protein